MLALIIYPIYLMPFRNGLRKQRHRDFTGAEADYTAMLRRNPNFWKASHNRAMIRLQNGNTEGALEDINQVMIFNPRSADAYNLRGDINIIRGRLTEAEHDLQETLSMHAKPAQKAYASSRLGYIKFIEHNRVPLADVSKRKRLLDESLAFYEEALRIQPTDVLAIVGKAQIFRIRNDIQGALAIYNEGLRRLPYSPQLLTDRSSIYISQGNLDAALADLSKSIYLNNKVAVSHNNRGYVHALRGDYEQALADCNRALELAPRLFFAYGSRGFTYYQMGNFDAALADFQAALDLKPDHPFALAGKAIALYRLDRADEAKALWRSLVEIDPAYTDPEQLKREYYSPAVFVEDARKIVALLNE